MFSNLPHYAANARKAIIFVITLGSSLPLAILLPPVEAGYVATGIAVLGAIVHYTVSNAPAPGSVKAVAATVEVDQKVEAEFGSIREWLDSGDVHNPALDSGLAAFDALTRPDPTIPDEWLPAPVVTAAHARQSADDGTATFYPESAGGLSTDDSALAPTPDATPAEEPQDAAAVEDADTAPAAAPAQVYDPLTSPIEDVYANQAARQAAARPIGT